MPLLRQKTTAPHHPRHHHPPRQWNRNQLPLRQLPPPFINPLHITQQLKITAMDILIFTRRDLTDTRIGIRVQKIAHIEECIQNGASTGTNLYMYDSRAYHVKEPFQEVIDKVNNALAELRKESEAHK
jgi:hypothetical protein